MAGEAARQIHQHLAKGWHCNDHEISCSLEASLETQYGTTTQHLLHKVGQVTSVNEEESRPEERWQEEVASQAVRETP